MEVTLPQRLEFSPVHPHINFLQVIRASYMMDLRIRFRYKANLIGDFIRSGMYIIVFSLFSAAYQFKTGVSSENATLLFFISGFLFIIFDGVALWAPLNTVNRDLYNGTLEYLFGNPFNRVGYFVGVVLASATTSSIMLVPIISFLLISGLISPVATFFVLADLILMATVLVAFGTMFALTALMWKQVGSLAGVLGMLFQFLSGFFFPIDVLPLPVKVIAFLLPYTWAIDIARYYAFAGAWNTILPVSYMWGILAAFGVVYWILATRMMKSVEKKSKVEGLHLL